MVTQSVSYVVWCDRHFGEFCKVRVGSFFDDVTRHSASR